MIEVAKMTRKSKKEHMETFIPRILSGEKTESLAQIL